MWWLLFLLQFPLPGTAAPVCSPEMFGTCKTFAGLPLNLSGSKKLQLPITPGATMIYNTVNGVTKDNSPPPKETPALRARAETLGRQAIAAAKELIAGGVDAAYLSAEQKALIARLDAVKVRVPHNSDPECKMSKDSVRSAPEASYAIDHHQLIICPTAANLAPASLLLILTHEIGHAVSPCMMDKDMFGVKPALLAGCKLGKEEREFAKEALADTAFEFMPAGKALDPDLAKLIPKLEKCGALIPRPEANFHGRPKVFEKLSTCLDTRYTAAWKNSLKRKNDFDAYDRAPGGDAHLRCQSIYDEHFADAFGARVFGRILAASPAPRDFARVALIEPAISVCLEKGEKSRGDYPPDSERFFLHLAAPATQKALGCVAPQSKSCGMTDFFTYPSVPGAGADEEAPGGGTSAN